MFVLGSYCTSQHISHHTENVAHHYIFMIFFRFDEPNGNYDDLRRSLSSDDGFPPGPLGLRERLGAKFPFPPGIFLRPHLLIE